MELVVKTRDGAPVTHDVTKNTVRMVGADGEAKDFVSADDVPVAVAKTVELDFSGGDMVVTPEAGQTFSSIVIPKPESLIPGNIAADKEVAGIIGALPAGGDIKVAFGLLTGDSSISNRSVTHGLGVMPDFVMRWRCAYGAYNTDESVVEYGISSGLKNLVGATIGTVSIYRDTSGNNKTSNWENGIGVFTGIHADEKHIAFYKPECNGINYMWLAVAGLT